MTDKLKEYDVMNGVELFKDPKFNFKGPSVLLTGAAGFLGIHILKELVSNSKFAKIYCVVRDKSKIKRSMAYYKLDFPLQFVNVIEGDILNIPEAGFPNVDVVIHSAARIHCLKPLGYFQRDNIDTTHKLCEIYGDRVVFISSLSVFVSSNLSGEHKQESLPKNENYKVYGGYAQSKVIGEHLVSNSNGYIIRPGLITGSSTTGIFPPDSFFTQFIKNCVTTKYVPRVFNDAQVDVTPVDHCATRIVTMCENLQYAPKIRHIAANKPFYRSDLVGELIAKGLVDYLEFGQWEGAFDTLPSLQKILMQYAFHKNEMVKEQPRYFNIDLFQTTGHTYEGSEFFCYYGPLLDLYINFALGEMK